MISAQAALKTAQDELDKQQTAYDLNPKSISKDALDSAANAVANAKANLDVARKQRDLTKAGAWIYDINNQEKTYDASSNPICPPTRCFRSTLFGRPKMEWCWHQSHGGKLCLGSRRL